MTTKILLVDDHDLFRAGLRSILEKHPQYKVVGEAGNGDEAVRLAVALGPDVVLMDITMPGLNGVGVTRQILQERPGVRVIALSMHCERQFVAGMLEAGATGYLLKNSAARELPLAIDSVQRGESYLSPRAAEVVVQDFVRQKSPGNHIPAESLSKREREVLALLAEGLSNKQVASRLGIAGKTVETHRAQIMDKLGIHTVAGLTKYSIRHGLTSLEE